ncbi:hypothetical protein CTEN210_10662 [Chaetoceros tenuissimus]|uniref:H15 domain-containing protein n=1 Tax=Chaetoceros tenuissimus TaxID=426638 RepID=A0AAD3H8D5_9STRA|nr:hypothetical protein CTEN210_10662 [Chaetoceros tenuissimus]
MATIGLIKECILALGDRTGSSIPAMNKWIESEKSTVVKKHIMKAALKSGVEKGELIQVKMSYKLSADAKKELKKGPAKKKVAPKKKTTVTKKKTAPKKKAAPKKKTTTKKAAPKKKTAPKKKKTTTKKTKK